MYSKEGNEYCCGNSHLVQDDEYCHNDVRNGGLKKSGADVRTAWWWSSRLSTTFCPLPRLFSDEVRWILPGDDFYKININVAVFKQHNEAEIGVSVGFYFLCIRGSMKALKSGKLAQRE